MRPHANRCGVTPTALRDMLAAAEAASDVCCVVRGRLLVLMHGFVR